MHSGALLHCDIRMNSLFIFNCCVYWLVARLVDNPGQDPVFIHCLSLWANCVTLAWKIRFTQFSCSLVYLVVNVGNLIKMPRFHLYLEVNVMMRLPLASLYYLVGDCWFDRFRSARRQQL